MPQAMKAPTTRQTQVQFRSIALVAVGANTSISGGSLSSTIDSALQYLTDIAGVIPAVSRYFSTPAFPPGSGSDFVNAAFAWESDLSVQEMIRALHEVEAALGRVRAVRWGARTLDLDLIAVGETVSPDRATVQKWIDLPLAEQQQRVPDQLLIPHPRVQERAFVLVPLCDIAPDWRHPILQRTAAEMRDALPRADLDSVIPLENRVERP